MYHLNLNYTKIIKIINNLKGISYFKKYKKRKLEKEIIKRVVHKMLVIFQLEKYRKSLII
jgi:hypothetical protein